MDTWYELQSLTLEYVTIATETLSTEFGEESSALEGSFAMEESSALEGSFAMEESDVTLLAQIVKRTSSDEPSDEDEETEETEETEATVTQSKPAGAVREEIVQTPTPAGSGNGNSNGNNNGTGNGNGSGDENGTGTGTATTGNGTGTVTSGNPVSTAASSETVTTQKSVMAEATSDFIDIAMAGDGYEAESGSEGGQEDVPDPEPELVEPVVEDPAVYAVSDPVAEILNNPMAIALIAIIVGAVLVFAALYGYRRRKNA
ncbi:MAG: hypothetical protein LUG13_06345 [Oscillospiraceae bacterium]|nr:hypothetical protein [Oscillospiraceae bacterium]